jgi:hypothetical protein
VWIFLPNSFLSIVQKPDDTDTLTVRGRTHGDIESVFADAVVQVGKGTDYKYRAKVPRAQVAQMLHDQVMGLHYGNFKSAVKNHKRHDAYMRVWSAMYANQDH